MSTFSFLPLLLLVVAEPDLEIVALQTTGPGRIGDCNAVVARVHNAGAAATVEAPSVRLDLSGATRGSRTASAQAPLPPGETAEVWFQGVPLQAGLSQLEVTADPEGREREANETNNIRRVPRDPQLACGAPEPQPAAGLELHVRVTAQRDAPHADQTAPLEAAAVTVTSLLGVGVELANGVTSADGSVTLVVPADSRSPVLKIAASAPGCPPAVSLATPIPGATAPIEVAIELDCAGAESQAYPVTPGGAAGGMLEIEAALPGLLRVDDGAAESVTFGSRVTVRRPGATVRVRASSRNGTLFHDAAIEVPRDQRRTVVIDAPALQSSAQTVEDLRSGLLWTAGAPLTASFADAAVFCDDLERDGADDWRLPSIDELAFVLAATAAGSAGAGAGAPLRELSECCLWSSTEHAGLRLTFYLVGEHIYGRRGEEGGIGALCVRGHGYETDPLLVPARYHDRLPGVRRFRPLD